MMLRGALHPEAASHCLHTLRTFQGAYANRDLKPVNILIQSRTPHFHARLAALETVKDQSLLSLP